MSIDNNAECELSPLRQGFLVECNHCHQCAVVLPWKAVDLRFGVWRLSCKFCGYVQTRDFERYEICRDAFDWYFHQPLWLQVPVGSNILWAWNPSHVSMLRDYVTTKLRPKAVARGLFPQRKIPAWIIDRKREAGISRGLTRLERRIPEWWQPQECSYG
jgi:hypothetical protein